MNRRAGSNSFRLTTGHPRARRRLGGVAIAAATALIAAGCGGSSGGSSSGGSAASGSTTKDPLTVGVNMSQTGPFAPIGTSELRGIQLAVNQINAAGGVAGRKIQLETLDDASDPARAVTNVRQLIGDGAVAILGPTTGSTLGGTLPLTARQNVLQLVGVGPDFAGAEHAPANLFTVPPPVDVWLNAASCYLSKVVKATKVAGLFTPDAAGSVSQKKFPAVLQKDGIQLVNQQQVPLGATDTAVQWTQIKGSNPDAVLDWMTGAVGGLTLKDRQALGVTVPTIGYVSWGLPAVAKLAGPAAEGTVVAGDIAADQPTSNQKAFVTAYQQAYPDQMLDHFAAYGYDMVNLFAAAVKAHPGATQADGKALAQALEDSKPIQGVVANYKFQNESTSLGAHSGVKAADVEFLVIKNGKFERNPEQPTCS